MLDEGGGGGGGGELVGAGRGGIWIRGESGPGGLSVLVVPQHKLTGGRGGGDVGRGQFRHPQILVPCGRLREISARPNFCGTIDAKSARPEVGSPY